MKTKNNSIYGIHNLPFHVEEEGIFLTFNQSTKSINYERECLSDKEKKIITTDNFQILINPVEPLNKPKILSSYLFIGFENNIIIEPKSNKTIFLSFPIEIGIFILKGDKYQMLDVFTLSKQKFTLYGDPQKGLICKYWKSNVFSEIFPTDPLKEGVLKLTIANPNTQWIEIKKIILNAYGMKIYYNNNVVSMIAVMKLKNEDMAETDIEDAPLQNEMKKSLEVYTYYKMLVSSTKFIMDFGI